MSEKFYITTAIAYTSRKPHIGNTFEVVFTDAIARYKRTHAIISIRAVFHQTVPSETNIFAIPVLAKKSPKPTISLFNTINHSISQFCFTIKKELQVRRLYLQ